MHSQFEEYSDDEDGEVEEHTAPHRRGWGGAGGGLRPAGGADHAPFEGIDGPKRFLRMSTKAPDPELWHAKQEKIEQLQEMQEKIRHRNHAARVEKARKKREAEEDDQRTKTKSESDEFAAMRRQRKAQNKGELKNRLFAKEALEAMEARELDKERRRLFGSLQQIEQQLLEAEQNPSKTTTAMQNISGRRKSSMASMRRMPVVGLIRGDSSNPRYFSVAQNKVKADAKNARKLEAEKDDLKMNTSLGSGSTARVTLKAKPPVEVPRAGDAMTKGASSALSSTSDDSEKDKGPPPVLGVGGWELKGLPGWQCRVYNDLIGTLVDGPFAPPRKQKLSKRASFLANRHTSIVGQLTPVVHSVGIGSRGGFLPRITEGGGSRIADPVGAWRKEEGGGGGTLKRPKSIEVIEMEAPSAAVLRLMGIDINGKPLDGGEINRTSPNPRGSPSLRGSALSSTVMEQPIRALSLSKPVGEVVAVIGKAVPGENQNPNIASVEPGEPAEDDQPHSDA